VILCTKPRKGTNLVETAIVISILLVFVFGLFEYGRFIMVRNVYENAAREGCRYAVVHTNDKTTADVQNHVVQFLGGTGYQLENFNLTSNISVYKVDNSGNIISGQSWTDAAFGEKIAVWISGDYRPVLPVFLGMGNTIALEIKVSMTSEAN
jgi:Flp pilus assembly protein TadG